jgi:hypothetical protein
VSAGPEAPLEKLEYRDALASLITFPEVKIHACRVSSHFIVKGISKDSPSVSRLVKYLSTILGIFFDVNEKSESMKLIKAEENCTHILFKIRAEVLVSWAKIYLASAETDVQGERKAWKKPKYLTEIVQPYLDRLASAWLSTLQEIAKLKSSSSDMSEITQSASTGSASMFQSLQMMLMIFLQQGTLESIYSDGTKAIVLPALVPIRNDLIKAFATYVCSSSDDTISRAFSIDRHSTRDKPPTFFYTLAASAVETLIDWTSTTVSSVETITNHLSSDSVITALKLLSSLFHPSILGPSNPEDEWLNELFAVLEKTLEKEKELTVLLSKMPKSDESCTNWMLQNMVMEVLDKIIHRLALSSTNKQMSSNNSMYSLIRVCTAIIHCHCPSVVSLSIQEAG